MENTSLDPINDKKVKQDLNKHVLHVKTVH